MTRTTYFQEICDKILNLMCRKNDYCMILNIQLHNATGGHTY